MKKFTLLLLPWILYSLMIHKMNMRVDMACILSIVVMLLTGVTYIRKMYIINWVYLGVFIITTISYEFLDIKFIQNDPWLIASSTLAILSFSSLIIGKPLMMQYARNDVSPDKWAHPIFIKISEELTLIWGLIFGINFVFHVCALLDAKNQKLMIFSGYLLSLSGVFLSIKYPNYVRHKYKNIG